MKGFCIIEVSFDKKGNASDYRFLEANKAFEKQTGLLNAVGKTMKELVPAHEQYWFDIYGNIAKTGEPCRFENEAKGLGHYYDVYAFRIGAPGENHVAILFKDISEQKRFEIQLKENYDQIQLATKAANAGWGYRNFITGEAYWDEKGKKILGFPNEEDSHTVEGWKRRVHPQDLPKVEVLMADCIQKDKPFDLEYRVICADGDIRFVHAMGIFSKDEEGNLLKGGGLVMDITDRKQREQQQQFLLRFSDILRAEPNADAIANRAIQMLAKHLQLDRCYVGIALLDDNLGIFPYQFGNEKVQPMPEEGVRLSDFPDALRTTFDETLVIEDFQNVEGLTETEKQNFAALGFGALVVANIRKEVRNPDWAINAVSATPRQWSGVEISLIEQVTERTWAAIERAKAEEALQKSEEKYRTLFNSIDEGFSILELIFDDSGKVVNFIYKENNPAFITQVGLDLQGKRRSELSLDKKDFLLEKYEHLIKTGEPLHFEYSVESLGRQWFQVTAARIGGKDSKHIGVIFRNITERKRREFNLAFLAEISHDLSIMTGIEKTMKHLGKKIGQHFGVQWCMFSELIQENEFAVAAYGWNDEEVPSLMGTYRMRDYLTDEQLAKNNAGEITICCDTQTDPNVDGEAYAALGIRSFINIPLSRNGQW